jgi:hypothetical protein
LIATISNIDFEEARIAVLAYRAVRMTRKFIQIVLLMTLLGTAMSQALACVTQQSDPHSCCRTFSTGQVARVRLAAKRDQAPATLPPCCTVSVPIAPQQATVNHRELQPNLSVPAGDERIGARPSISINKFKLTPSSEPSGYSPPSFILHHALLI